MADFDFSIAKYYVFVGPLLPCITNKNWRYKAACHMFVSIETDIEVLHAMANKIGLKRSWFQDRGSMPHYDLNGNKRVQAIVAGALSVSSGVEGGYIRRWRLSK